MKGTRLPRTVALLAAALLTACANGTGGSLVQSLEGAQAGEASRRNDARVSVQRTSSGPLALVWTSPDGRPRVTTLPPGVRSAEVLESREVTQRGEYAAIVALRFATGSECPGGMAVERVVLSTPARSELASLGQCGAMARLGMSDDRAFIGVRMPNGQWRQMAGTRLVQPGSGGGPATLGPQPWVGPTLPAWIERTGPGGAQQGSETQQRPEPRPVRPNAPQARQPSTYPASVPEPRQPSRLDPSTLPSAPDGTDSAPRRAVTPNFGV